MILQNLRRVALDRMDTDEIKLLIVLQNFSILAEGHLTCQKHLHKNINGIT